MHDLVGGRYRLDQHIGNGGMAEVWRATDGRTGRTVAVKRLHPGLAHDPTSRARFAREVEAARTVDHPAAVRVLDAGEGPDGTWLAMEYLAGGSLADRLLDGPLPAVTVAAIGADIAEALAAVHAAGLVHRDVKPSNILLDAAGGARLGDFGIARTEAPDGLEDVTATGDVVGTLRFLPPEVLAGGPAAPASDVWALGAVLYEALTGRPPFDASSPAALVASQRSLPARPSPDDGLGDVLEAMLDRDPAARPRAVDAGATLRAAAGAADPAEDRTAVVRLLAPVTPAALEPASSDGVAPILASSAAASRRPGRTSRRVGLAPVGLLAAVLLVGGLVLAVNAPFAGPATPAGAAPTTRVVDAEPTATPDATTGAAPAGEPKGKGGGNGQDKGKDKPDKPDKGKGKGNGG
jgi:hypothetical protein